MEFVFNSSCRVLYRKRTGRMNIYYKGDFLGWITGCRLGSSTVACYTLERLRTAVAQLSPSGAEGLRASGEWLVFSPHRKMEETEKNSSSGGSSWIDALTIKTKAGKGEHKHCWFGLVCIWLLAAGRWCTTGEGPHLC